MAKMCWSRISGLMAACTLMFASSVASADAGDGVQNEYFVLHAGANVQGGVNTNLFFQDSGEQTPGVIPQLFFQPYLNISNQPKAAVDFNLNWKIGWTQYASSDSAILDQSGLNTLIGAGATFNPRGNVSFRVNENFTRTNEPPNNPGGDSIHRVVNRVGGVLGIHPGGRVFQGYLGYHWNLYDFSQTVSSLNKTEHEMKGRFVWQFLPRTAALLTSTYSIISYESPFRTTPSGVATGLANVDSTPLRIQGGLSGLITNGLALTLLAGYGWAFYESGPSTDGLLFTGQLAYMFGPGRKSKVGFDYSYGFHDSSLGNFYTAHTFGLNYAQSLSNERLNFNAGVSFVMRDYVLGDGASVPLSMGGTATVPSQINDNLLNGNLGLSYSFTKWFDAGATYHLRLNSSASNIQLTSGQEDIAGRSYLQHIVMVRAGFHY
jgi:hypothetical protein